MNRLVIGLICVALFESAAHAWDAGGHEIVATIAYAHLNPKARAAVDALAPQISRPAHPYDAISLAGWMDDIRHDQTLADYGKFKSWHYIDIPIDARDPMPPFEPGTDNEEQGNAVQGLKRALVVLKGGTDPYVTSQPMALAILEHLVGDIHQPLHCATKYFFSHGELRDDKGGNDEFVLNGPPGNDKFNLHAFWDSAYCARFDDATGNIMLDERLFSKTDIETMLVRDLASSAHREIKPGVEDGVSDFQAWVLESHAIARDFVYPGITVTDNRKNCRLSSSYVAHANAIAWQQLAIAGTRLAALLNATLGSATPGSPPPSYPAGPPASRW